MNRQPFLQPCTWTNPPRTSHFSDEDVDRRVVAPCGRVMVVFLCKATAKKPKMFRPRLVHADNNETVLYVTISKGNYFVSNWYRSTMSLLAIRVRDIPSSEDIVARLLKIYEACKL